MCLVNTLLAIKNFNGTTEVENDKFEFIKIKIFYIAKHIYKTSKYKKNHFWENICNTYDRISMCVCPVAQSCLALCDPMDYSPPGSIVHGIFQAGILEWLTIAYSKGSSQPRDWTHVSCISCSRQILTTSATWEAESISLLNIKCSYLIKKEMKGKTTWCKN